MRAGFHVALAKNNFHSRPKTPQQTQQKSLLQSPQKADSVSFGHKIHKRLINLKEFTNDADMVSEWFHTGKVTEKDKDIMDVIKETLSDENLKKISGYQVEGLAHYDDILAKIKKKPSDMNPSLKDDMTIFDQIRLKK